MAAMNTDVITAEPSLNQVHQEQEVDENGEKIIIRGICAESELESDVCHDYTVYPWKCGDYYSYLCIFTCCCCVPFGIYCGRKAPKIWCLYLTESAIYYRTPVPFKFNLPIRRYALSDIADIKVTASAYGIVIILKETTTSCCFCCSELYRHPLHVSITCCENGFIFVEAVKERMLIEQRK